MIEVRNLTKRYGTTLAINDLSFDVSAGRVTGFLGPNGAGKSTTMRLTVGLDAPTAGTVTVAGRPYRSLRRPLFVIGHTKFTPPGHQLTPWTGLGLFAAYTAVTLIAAAVTLNQRDA